MESDRSNTSNKFTFTVTALKAVTCPPGSDRVYVYDAKTPALAFCVTSKGRRSFYFYRWLNGRPERSRVGGFPDITIEQARNRVEELNGDVARGLDPQQARREKRAEPTLGELLTAFVEKHGKLHKKTWERDQQQFDLHRSDWRTRRLGQVSGADVRARHARIGEKHGHYAANRVLALLHSLYAKAGELVGWKGENPAHGVKRFKERERDRFLRGDELPRFFQALDAEPRDNVRDYVWMSLLTGVRRGNVQAMRWDEVNLGRAEWVIAQAVAADFLGVWWGFDSFCRDRLGVTADAAVRAWGPAIADRFAAVLKVHAEVTPDAAAERASREGMETAWGLRFGNNGGPPGAAGAIIAAS